MTETRMAERLIEAREALGLSRRSLAVLIAEDEVQVRRMEAEQAEVWPELVDWLERQAARRQADPPPGGGTLRAGKQARSGPRKERKGQKPVEPGSDAARIRRALGVIHWSSNTFGEALGLSGQAIRLWIEGRGAARPEALAWVERQAKAFEDDPPPQRVLPGGVWASDVQQAAAVLGAQARMLRQGGAASGAEGLERVLALLDRLPGLLREMEARLQEAAAPRPAAVGKATIDASRWAAFLAPPPPLGPRPPGPMAPARLERILEVLGWSSNDLAQRSGSPAIERDIRRWAKGQRPIGQDVADWLEGLGAVAEQRPAEIVVWAHAPQRLRNLPEPAADAGAQELAAWAETLLRLRRLTREVPEGAAEWEERLTEVAADCPDRLRSKKVGGPMTLDEIL